VLRDDDVLSEVSGDPTLAHGQRLPGDLDRALAAAGVTLDQVGLLSVVAGPGSFTGLRIGIAAMQGLAFSRGLTVVPVSALDAIARLTLRTAGDGVLVAVWIDAQRGEVFATVYDGSVGRPLVAASSAPPAATLEAWVAALGTRPVVFAGDGAVRYKDVIARILGSRATVREPAPALAAEAARIAAEHPERAVAPHGILPIYVRRPDVELTRERSSR
jgi:tRNA threonylcarbamoyladenosine biosynthesis protein TsaB